MFDLNQIIDDKELEALLQNQRGGFNLVRTNTKTNRKFNLEQTTYQYRIDNNEEQRSLFDAERNFRNFIAEFSTNHIDRLNNNCKIKLLITHPTFDVPINTNYLLKSQYVPEIISKLFYNVVQSRKKTNKLQLTDADEMNIILTVATTVNGTGKKRTPLEEILCTNYVSYKKVKSMREHCKETPCIVSCEEDNFCLLRSILLGKLFLNNLQEFRLRSRPGDASFTRHVTRFAEQNELPDHPYGLDLGHVELIESLVDHQIIVYQDSERTPLYWNKSLQEKPKIYILYNSQEHHFSLIKHIKAYFSMYFCELCMKPYKNLGTHKCPATCPSCYRPHCPKEREDQKCKCGATIFNDKCQAYHNLKCLIVRKCETCTGLKNAKHVCLKQKFCANCDKVVEINHMCFIKSEVKPVKFRGFIFFDFEAYEDPLTQMHVVNLAMAKRVCLQCYKTDLACRLCLNKYIFYNIHDFVSWIRAHENREFICYAHNAKGYDAQFILQEIYKTTCVADPKINVIVNGSKIMEIRYAGIIIRDSANFIPMPLSQFPKAFNLSELKKGYFPHKFNKPENKNYVGPYPDAKYYQPEFMTREKKQDFEQFYRVQINRKNVFDFKKEFEDYCWSDVMLLTEGCMRYSRLSRESSKLNEADEGFDPLVHCMTLASACNTLYRRNYMPKNKIAVLPACGFNPKSNMSRASELWLKYYSERNNLTSKIFKNYYCSIFYFLLIKSSTREKRWRVQNWTVLCGRCVP
jgi:hypothetical protein